ncbi:dihydropteroate synthase-like protein [Methanolobus sp. ZRKC3]|uniref:dihydropteroate synthase-like protein n=1 Tax=Methanolobus sp. ZRKC3 TaxID=3125786 RepID=UPI00324FDAA7
MKVLVATGRLAEQTVRDSIGDSADVIVVDTEIAAFITPRKLMDAIKRQFPSFDYDLIFIPGLVSSNFSRAEEELACKIRLGPKHAYDLSFVIPFADNMEFSSTVAACELLSDVRRELALEKISELEDNSIPTMQLGGIKLGGNTRMKVLAEVVDATGLDSDSLTKRISTFIHKGADMIDLGASLHAEPEDVERAIGVARSVTSTPLSIDTLDPLLIERALETGIDLVLSLDSNNIDILAPRIAEADVPAVVIPDSGKGMESLVANIEHARSLGIRKIIADPVLDPIGHGIAVSIVRYREFHERFPDIPVFFGIGNVTELIDADCTGVNATLCGIGADVGASILFTPEYSNKTQGSINELKRASQMMVLSKERNSSPKDLGIDLMEIKEKRRRTDAVMPESFTEARDSKMWKLDPSGCIRINIVPDGSGPGGYILAEHENATIVGSSAGEIMDTIIEMGLVSRLEHAGYLGSELKKAEIALKFNRSYSQDDVF